MLSRKKLIVIAFVLVIYVIGYIGARSSNFIVHSVVRDHGDNYLEHSVVTGEGRFLGALIKGVTSRIYTPVRYLETRYWYWQQPVGTPLSKKHLEALQYSLTQESDRTSRSIRQLTVLVTQRSLTKYHFRFSAVARAAVVLYVRQ